MTLQEFQRRRAALSAATALVCRHCGVVGEAGCPHLVEGAVGPPSGFSLGRMGLLLIDARTPVSIAISSTTGLPIAPRW
jgi:hypothetical protein